MRLILTLISLINISIGVASWYYVLVNINKFPPRIEQLTAGTVAFVVTTLIIYPLVAASLIAEMYR